MIRTISNFYYDFDYEVEKLLDKIATFIAWKLVPKWLAYRVFVRVAVYKELGNPGETKCVVALDRFRA